MPKASLAEADLQQLYHQFASQLAQAHNLDTAVGLCLALLERSFRPRACQLVWVAGNEPRLLGSLGSRPLLMPSAAQRAWLEDGDLALSPDETEPVACFVPLRSRGALVGWAALEQPRWQPESIASLQSFAAHASPVLALLEASERFEDRLAQLSTLTDIGRVLSVVLDLDTLLDAIYRACQRVVDVSNFYIALYDDASDTLEMVYYVSEGQRWQGGARWRPGDGLAGVLIAQRAPLCTDDYAEECRRHGLAPLPINDSRVVKAWLGVPLFVQDRLVGMLNVSSYRDGYSYRPEHVDLLATIGAQAGVAIDNARLFQRAERQARQLRSLNQIGRILNSSLDPEHVPALIMEQVCKLMGVEEGSLLLTEEPSGDLVFAYTTGPIGNQLLGQRVPRGVGLAGYVVAKGESVISNDVQRDDRFYANTDRTTGYTTRTLMAVPLRGVAGVQGVIEVMNRLDGRIFSAEDQRLLEGFADQAVIALENARKFAQVDQALTRRALELARTNTLLQHNLQSLTALNALGLAINGSQLTPEEVFSMSARGLVEITEALGAEVLIQQDDGGFRTLVQVGTVAGYAPITRAIARVQDRERPELIDYPGDPVRRALVVPLLGTRRMLGVLCVYYPEGLPIEADQETVVLFATQAARAVENIELFTDVSVARDQMASILASTHEGFLLIEPDAQIVIANEALRPLTGVEQPLHEVDIQTFLDHWRRATDYAPEQWTQLRRALDGVISGRESAASGELDATRPSDRSVEWAALTAKRSGDAPGGALLVLRDITEAKEAERLRRDLTNMIIHDLRNPLANIMAGTELLVRGVSGDLNVSQRNVLNISYASAIQMLGMVDTLLDISRLEDGRMPLDQRSTDLLPLVMRAHERLASLARERGVAIRTDLPDDLPPVYVDEELIVRVLQNLIGNAIKFSGNNTTVVVRGKLLHELPPGVRADGASDTPAGPMVCLSVSDQGVGIAQKDLEKIFGMFSQVDKKSGGTGLGLTFCKLVTEGHGGAIWVESELGVGSTFFLTLPALV